MPLTEITFTVLVLVGYKVSTKQSEFRLIVLEFALIVSKKLLHCYVLLLPKAN
jgi:hypothetical protein